MFEREWNKVCKIALTVGAMLFGGVASAHEVTIANHAYAGVGAHYVHTLGAGNVHYTAGTFGAGDPCNPRVSAFTFSYPQVQYVPAPASFLPQVAAPVQTVAPVTVAGPVPAAGVEDGDYADEAINDATVDPVPVPQPVYGPGFSGNAGLGVGNYGAGLGYLNRLGVNRFGVGNGLNYLNRLRGLGHNGVGHNGVGHNGVGRGVGHVGGVRRGPVARAARAVGRAARGVARAARGVNRPLRTNTLRVGGHAVARTTVHRR